LVIKFIIITSIGHLNKLNSHIESYSFLSRHFARENKLAVDLWKSHNLLTQSIAGSQTKIIKFARNKLRNESVKHTRHKYLNEVKLSTPSE
jgi:hypothetical protein